MKYFSRVVIIGTIVTGVLFVVKYIKNNMSIIWLHDKDE